MGEDKKMIYGLLEEIRELVAGSEKEDGTFRFDPLRVRIALEFTKSTIEKSLAEYQQTRETDIVYVNNF